MVARGDDDDDDVVVDDLCSHCVLSADTDDRSSESSSKSSPVAVTADDDDAVSAKCSSSCGRISAKSGRVCGSGCHADVITDRMCLGNCAVGDAGNGGRPVKMSMHQIGHTKLCIHLVYKQLQQQLLPVLNVQMVIQRRATPRCTTHN